MSYVELRFQRSLSTARQAIVVFLVLATLTTDVVSTVFILGRLTFFECLIAIFTVLCLSGGTGYTVLWISHEGLSQPPRARPRC